MNIKMVGAVVLAGAMIAGCGEKVEDKKSEREEDAMAVSVNGEKLMQSAIDADVEKFISTKIKGN